MKKVAICLIACLCLMLCAVAHATEPLTVDVIADYGAAGDGVSNDREAIQTAIDDVAAQGGGTVTLTAGKTFLSGNLILKSNVTLHFGDGAVLLQSGSQSDFVIPSEDGYTAYQPETGHNTIDVRWGHAWFENYPLVHAGEGTSNVKITGNGTIQMTRAETCDDTIHMCPVGFYRASNFEISDITVLGSANYGMMLFTCNDGLVQNVKMDDFWDANGDGISMQNCQNMRVTGCNLNVTDDAIYIWTSYEDPRGGTWWNSNNPQPSTNFEIDNNTTVTPCKGFGFILWGSSCPDQYKVEASNVYVHDNNFSSLGIWNDDPYDSITVPTPVKNVRFENNTIAKIQDNFYATPISNMSGYASMTEFMNTGFENTETYWIVEKDESYAANAAGTSTYNCGQDGTRFGYMQNLKEGKTISIYQGLWLDTGRVYTFSAKLMTSGNTCRMFVRDAATQTIIATQDFSNTAWEEQAMTFTVPASANYQIGIDSGSSTTGMARMDSVELTSTVDPTQTIFTTQVPEKFGSDNVYELGTRFKTTANGRVTKVRLYTHAEECGVHTVRLWDYSAKTIIAGPYEWDVPAGTEGWQEFEFPESVKLTAGKDYVVSISNNATNKYYAQTPNGLSAQISNANLIAYAKGGLWFRGTGSMPYNQVNTNYFRDIVFEVDEQSIFTTQTPDGVGSDTFYELGTRFKSNNDGFVTHVRIYTSAEECGIHTVRLWDYSAKTLLAGPYEWDVPAGTEGWQEFELPEPLSIVAGKDYVVAVSNNADNKYYAKGTGDTNSLKSNVSNGDLTAYATGGLWSRNAGDMPYNKVATNYFRDVIFVLDKANRTELREAVALADALNESDYTAASWAEFAPVLTEVKAVLTTPKATQEQVDAAAVALAEAGQKLVKIQTITPTVTVEGGPFTYNATEQTPAVTVMNGSDVISAELYIVAYTNNLNAGTATVTVTSVAGAEFKFSATATFTIEKAVVLVTADDKTAQVGDAMPTFTYTVTGLVGEDTMTFNPMVICAGNTVTAGTYEIKASGGAVSDNYTLSYKNGTFTVTERVVTYVVYACGADGVTRGYETFAEALADTDATFLKLAGDVDGAVIEQDVLLDLNGYSMTNVTIPAGVTVTGMDASTDDYDCADGYGKISGTIEGTIAVHVKTTVAQTGSIKRYIAVPEGDSWSFHRVYLAINSVGLRIGDAAISYKAIFAADAVAHSYLAETNAFGVALQLGSAPQSLEEKCFAHFDKADFVPGLKDGKSVTNVKKILVTNVLTGDAAADAERAEIAIYGCAYLQLADGTVIMSSAVSPTFRQVMELFDGYWASLTDAQKLMLNNFYKVYATTMESWELKNIGK